MKQLSLLHQTATRRTNSLRTTSDAPDIVKSPATLFWILLHALCCLISLLLGFRFSRLVFFLVFTTSGITSPSILKPPITISNRTGLASSRVVVGRHGILIRPWPHPNPLEVMRAHKILDRVQKEQKAQFGVKDPKTLIVVTTTYVRTFQALHLTSLMHSLMNVPYDVVWVVVEAGGVTNETAALIAKANLRPVHLGFQTRMPLTWAHRFRLEDLMRMQALRFVMDQKLDGIVMFADDSNMHSLEFFDEAQKVNWIGALTVGILVHSGDPDSPLKVKEVEKEEGALPVQGPACNSTDSLVGWYTFDAAPYAERSAVIIGDMGTVLPRKIEWAGFVLNSKLLWRDDVDKPEWMNDLDSLADESVDSPLSLLKDHSVVEPLGSCGRKVMLWWLRVEARADSKFPPGWVIDPPLEITVPAKHTPWPEIPPELPATEKVTAVEQHLVEETVKRPPKAKSRKKSSRGKKRREARVSDTQVSSRQVGEK
ncbi:hypothetical protein KSS87_011522 [Heliosperma pusillum]|nr:hypothetical protein KSS87_011522 [Heliosperma pusillum]